MAVRLRMKKMGRKHQPFFRVVAVDQRAARDGKVIEYLGHYDPLVKETDARALLNAERIDYWLSVGAQPSDKVGVLIKKYGTNGTHLEQQRAAKERVQTMKPTAPPASGSINAVHDVYERTEGVVGRGSAESHRTWAIAARRNKQPADSVPAFDANSAANGSDIKFGRPAWHPA